MLGVAQIQMNVFEVITADYLALFKSSLRLVHFVGLAIGLGAATLLDLLILRFFATRRFTWDMLDILILSSKVVSFGLVLLWISGFGFLEYYYFVDPEKLYNPKIHAKLAIVVILTLNGFLLHRYVMPYIEDHAGGILIYDLPSGRRQLMMFTACVSVVSWYAPLVIANLPQLNFSVPVMDILGLYIVALLAAITVAQIGLMGFNFHTWLTRRRYY